MSEFAARLIAWQKVHGRHDLPWQNTIDPYAIWVSEIMLQQTQVTAVIGYYQRFMVRFPTIASLAQAEQDEVLQYWSGLGYYSRARNLHHAAQTIMDDFDGVFPQDFARIQGLSGIGRSTAAAIAAFAFQQTQTILDGNVKRVLARHFLIEGWPSAPKVEQQLWALAESLLPSTDMVAYTQGLMDLGATVCTRKKPKCDACPLQSTCGAFAQQRVNNLPTPKPKKALPQNYTTMLILLSGAEVMLEKRPSQGIWGGLWSLPEIDMAEIGVEVALSRFGLATEALETLPVVQHAFSHYKLAITPQPLTVIGKNPLDTDTRLKPSPQVWLQIQDAIGAAIPTPVRKILLSLQQPLAMRHAKHL
jgi:A/G-specific adenine glycosylase